MNRCCRRICRYCSLEEAYLPISQKAVIIKPLIKKRELGTADRNNYRPVFNLTFVSLVWLQLAAFLEANDALPVTQSAYRKFHSTESALLKVYPDLCLALGKGHVALLGLPDLSAEFDTVEHEILLKRLESSCGMTEVPLNWLRSYITEREQSVNVCSAKSAKVQLNCGVPQGSVLGPLLFVLYTKDVIDIIKGHGLINHCYADDAQLYFYCSPEELDALASAFGICTEELCAWMRSTRLKLNCEKTECIWLCTKQRRKTLSAPALHVGDAAIQLISGVRNPGVFFDSHLDLKQHISNICRSCYFQLRQLRVVRRSLPPRVLRILLHSFVSCCQDYCNSLMVGLPLCDIQLLQSVQNAAARLFGGVSKRGNMVPVLRDDLHWLPIK